MGKEITFIQWNISCSADPGMVAERLMKEIDGPFLISLMEVLPAKYYSFKSQFAEEVDTAYSLEYRKPGKYDTRKRMLGVLFIAGNGVSLTNSNVMNRTLYPDRTLLSEFVYDNQIYKIASMHSITGCDHYKAKSDNFLACTEEIDTFRPDVFTIDANEPELDHFEVSKMEFFDNGKGARVLFSTLSENGLTDSYIIHYDRNNFEEGKPVVVSHKIGVKKRECRYDFLFIDEKRFNVESVEYILDETITDCKADHAMIVVKAEVI